MKLLPCGDRAVLIDCASLAEAQGWFAALHDEVDAVLGARTVLLRGEPSTCARSSTTASHETSPPRRP